MDDNNDQTPSATRTTNQKSRFLWDKKDRIIKLLHALKEFKTEMYYKGIGFDDDKVRQYEAVREKLSEISDVNDFGPKRISSVLELGPDATEEEKVQRGPSRR
jgi:hypothetical protein